MSTLNNKKSLNEEVATIIASNNSLNNKKRALAKLGITPYEITLLTANMPVDSSRVRSINFTFGVEIECGVEQGAIRRAADETGVSYQYERYNHTDGHSYFKFTTDASVSCPNAIECVSPVLKGKDGRDTLAKMIKTLNQAGAVVNKSCGLHVHIGARDLNNKQYCNVFANYYHLETVIDSFMAESRRGNNNFYCQGLRNHNFSRCNTISDIQNELNADRYHKVNPMSYNRHRTIEFRQHQGTVNEEKILNWITFCGKLVEWSKKNRLTADVTSIDEIPFLTKAEKKFFNKRAEAFASNR